MKSDVMHIFDHRTNQFQGLFAIVRIRHENIDDSVVLKKRKEPKLERLKFLA